MNIMHEVKKVLKKKFTSSYNFDEITKRVNNTVYLFLIDARGLIILITFILKTLQNFSMHSDAIIAQSMFSIRKASKFF